MMYYYSTRILQFVTVKSSKDGIMDFNMLFREGERESPGKRCHHEINTLSRSFSASLSLFTEKAFDLLAMSVDDHGPHERTCLAIGFLTEACF